jgi:hypothetical protein
MTVEEDAPMVQVVQVWIAPAAATKLQAVPGPPSTREASQT